MQVQLTTLMILVKGLGLILFVASLLLIIEIRRNPSTIRLTPMEGLRRLKKQEPLWLQWAFLKILFWRFGREILAGGLIFLSFYCLFLFCQPYN